MDSECELKGERAYAIDKKKEPGQGTRPLIQSKIDRTSGRNENGRRERYETCIEVGSRYRPRDVRHLSGESVVDKGSGTVVRDGS